MFLFQNRPTQKFYTLAYLACHVYIFARPQPSSQTRYNADAFLAIDKISITCMNKTGILSAMSQQQLYNISAENVTRLEH